MVAVVRPAPSSSLTRAGPETFAAWLERVGAAYPADERAAIAKALDAARARYGEERASVGDPWLARALGTAEIVAWLRLDAVSVRAAILLGFPALSGFDAATLSENFGDEIAQIVVGVSRMGAIRAAQEGGDKAERDAQAENLRKMLLAMVEDIRVVLIKLAERTQALRFLIGSDDAGEAGAAAAAGA